MWKDFQKVLEKRVQGGSVFRRDKYFIQQVVNETILECFGKIGRENVSFELFKQKNLVLKSSKSVWKSEVKMKEGFLLKQINLKMKDENAFGKIFFKS